MLQNNLNSLKDKTMIFDKIILKTISQNYINNRQIHCLNQLTNQNLLPTCCVWSWSLFNVCEWVKQGTIADYKQSKDKQILNYGVDLSC